MADTQAYRLKADTAIPRPIRKIDELHDGTPVFETVGVAYNAGDYVFSNEMTPTFRESIDRGEMDAILEPASADEANEARQTSGGAVVVPEHEVERVALQQSGVTTVPRSQLIEMNSAGAEGANEAMQAAKESGADERPALTDPYVADLAAVSRGEHEAAVAEDAEPVPDELVEGVERPPGLPTGSTLAAASGGGEQQRAARPRPQPKEKQKPAQAQAQAQQQQKEEKK